jgi:LuxR family transcriptional regulator, maltose regulon positive regulatory protein
MTVPVTRTKILVPRCRSDIFSRRRLLDLLYILLDYKLIIITAPAGYGKTSLLVDFASKTELPVCWYSLDYLDQDFQRFIAHFIASIQLKYPAFGAQSSAALESTDQSSPDLDRLVMTIVNDVYENVHEHFVNVLDDYHLVNDSKEIDYFINRFIQDVGENCHIILSSRALLTLPDMPLLVARSQVAGLSFEELVFHPDEIQMLVYQNNHIDLTELAAQELAKETEGWITGLLLSTQLMSQGMADRIRVARVSGVGLYDYLAQQVLDQQPPQVREFLIKTSYLEEFDALLCNEVFGPEQDWAKLIDAILQHNLFVLPVGDDGKWIRYHHLFRDFLQARLELEFSAQKRELLDRIADAYTNREEWDKAYSIYSRQKDTRALAHFIGIAGTPLMRNGRLITLREWMNGFSEDLLGNFPTLLSLKGIVLSVLGNVDQGLSLLNRAVASLWDGKDAENLALALVRRAVAYRYKGKYQESFDDASLALSIASDRLDLRSPKAEALRAIGISLYHMGKIPEAVSHFKGSLEVYEALHDRQNVAILFMELGLAYMNTGQFNEALFNYKHSLAYWRETNNTLREATLFNNLAVLNHLLGDYPQAANYYEDGLVRARQNQLTRTEAYILSGIGDLYVDLSASAEAADAYRQAREIAQQIDYLFLLIYVSLAEATQARKSGNVIEAQRLVATAERMSAISSSAYEKALCLLEEGQIARVENNLGIASGKIIEAARLFEQGGYRVEAARTYLFAAAAIFYDNHMQDSLKTLDRAFQIASQMDSQHVLVVAGKNEIKFLEAIVNQPGSHQQAENLLKQIQHFEKNIPSLRKRLRPRVSSIPFAPPKLIIKAFGRTLVEVDGDPVSLPEWQNQKRVREFFFYLLAQHDGKAKEEIGAIFWPDSTPGQLKLQFKNTIYRLRCALGQEVIAYNDDIYWFNRHLDYEYDVETYIGKVILARETKNRLSQIQLYGEAVSIYKGSFLPEFDADWARLEREHLWQFFIDSLIELAKHSMDSGDYNSTLDYCQKILTEDICQEEAHRLAMRAYAAKGNRSAVKRQFENCKKALSSEIQSEPSSQTVKLYETLNG